MNITVDYKMVTDINPGINREGIYIISIEFENEEVCCYAYGNQLNFKRDYKRLIKEWEENC